jgi:hypothetical protein
VQFRWGRPQCSFGPPWISHERLLVVVPLHSPTRVACSRRRKELGLPVSQIKERPAASAPSEIGSLKILYWRERPQGVFPPCEFRTTTGEKKQAAGAGTAAQALFTTRPYKASSGKESSPTPRKMELELWLLWATLGVSLLYYYCNLASIVPRHRTTAAAADREPPRPPRRRPPPRWASRRPWSSPPPARRGRRWPGTTRPSPRAPSRAWPARPGSRTGP